MNATLNGRYRFEIVKPNGLVETPFDGQWINNTVVNAGLDSLFNRAQAVGTTAQINGSGYGFLVPMTWCRMSETDSRAIDVADATFQLQGAASAQYTKSFPAIPDTAAVTTTSANFTVPAAGATVVVDFASTSGLGAGYPILIAGAGYFLVVTVDSGTQATIRNVGATVAESTVISSGAGVDLYYPTPVNSVAYDSDATWIWADFQRTFVFPPSAVANETNHHGSEAPGTSRNWVGAAVSHTNINTDPVFSRVVLPATVTVLGTEELRVIYQLRVRLPKVAAAVALTNGGFDATGDIKAVGSYAALFGGITSAGIETGATTANSLPHIMRGNGTPTGYLLANSAFPSEGAAITPSYSGTSQADSTTTTVTPATYTNGTFSRDFPLIWGTNRPAATQTDIRSFLLSTATPAGGIQWLMDADQTKTPDKALSATFRIAWARP